MWYYIKVSILYIKLNYIVIIMRRCWADRNVTIVGRAQPAVTLIGSEVVMIIMTSGLTQVSSLQCAMVQQTGSGHAAILISSDIASLNNACIVAILLKDKISIYCWFCIYIDHRPHLHQPHPYCTYWALPFEYFIFHIYLPPFLHFSPSKTPNLQALIPWHRF